ncbi:MAG TPA: hypothetical protein VGI66_01905 [Streptosporangiaceae bacterium]
MNAWLGLLAVLTCVTLVLTALRPGLAVSLVIFSWPAIEVRTGSPLVRRSASGVPGRTAGLGLHSGGGLAQLQVSRIASTSFRVIRPVLFEVLRTS